MSQYITKNKLSRVQMEQLIQEKDKLISDLQSENSILHNVISHISGKEIYIEEKGIDVNKRLAVYLSKKSPMSDNDGNITGMIGVSFEISDRKKMEHDLKVAKEKAEASDHAKSQFLAVMNHELNT